MLRTRFLIVAVLSCSCAATAQDAVPALLKWLRLPSMQLDLPIDIRYGAEDEDVAIDYAKKALTLLASDSQAYQLIEQFIDVWPTETLEGGTELRDELEAQLGDSDNEALSLCLGSLDLKLGIYRGSRDLALSGGERLAALAQESKNWRASQILASLQVVIGWSQFNSGRREDALVTFRNAALQARYGFKIQPSVAMGRLIVECYAAISTIERSNQNWGDVLKSLELVRTVASTDPEASGRQSLVVCSACAVAVKQIVPLLLSGSRGKDLPLSGLDTIERDCLKLLEDRPGNVGALGLLWVLRMYADSELEASAFDSACAACNDPNPLFFARCIVGVVTSEANLVEDTAKRIVELEFDETRFVIAAGALSRVELDDLAQEFALKLVQELPESGLAHTTASVVFARSGLLSRALESARLAVRYGSDLAESHIALGVMTLICESDYDRALISLREGARLSGSERDYNRLVDAVVERARDTRRR